MVELHRDLARHCAWADAQHVASVGAHPAAAADKEILERLWHIWLCQSYYLKFLKGLPFPENLPEMAPGFPEIRQAFRDTHDEAAAYFSALTEQDLQRALQFPETNPPRDANVGEMILQFLLHSQNHRGQNATRLRQLAGSAPTTDYISWVLTGRPDPAW